MVTADDKSRSAEREQRLAAALRENLRRRKAQARKMIEDPPRPDSGGDDQP